MKPIIFWGATGQAKVLHEFINSIGFQLTALFDNNPKTESPFSSIPIYYGVNNFKEWLLNQTEEISGLVAIGGSYGKERLKIQDLFIEHNIKVPIAIHPTAFVAEDAVISEGCQVLAQTSVCTEVVLGKACIVNTSASVDHECKLGKGVHIAPGATLAGCVEVGNFSFIGTGAVILPKIKIGSNVIIGAGSVVTKDIESGTLVYGNPARHIRYI